MEMEEETEVIHLQAEEHLGCQNLEEARGIDLFCFCSSKSPRSQDVDVLSVAV